MIEPTLSVRAQIVALIAAQPDITSAAVAEALPTIERKAVYAHLANLAKRGRVARAKVDGSWCYRIAPGAAATDSSDLDDDDKSTTPAAPAARITTHVAEPPRRPGRVTAAEAARRKADAPAAAEAADVDAATAQPAVDTTTIADEAVTTTTLDRALDGTTGGGISSRPRYDEVGDAIRIAIDDEGSLSIDSPDVFLRLGPEHTRQLGTFLALTMMIWSRP